MKLMLDEQRTMPAARAARLPVLLALLWIVAGVCALLALCTFGPAIVEYASAAGLQLAVLAPLVSVVFAGWDVGGLMLIVIGVHRLRRARIEAQWSRGVDS